MFSKLISITLTAFTLFAATAASAQQQKGKEVNQKPVCISNMMMATDSYGEWVLMSMDAEPKPVSCADKNILLRSLSQSVLLRSSSQIVEVQGVKFREFGGSFTWVLFAPAASKK